MSSWGVTGGEGGAGREGGGPQVPGCPRIEAGASVEEAWGDWEEETWSEKESQPQRVASGAVAVRARSGLRSPECVANTGRRNRETWVSGGGEGEGEKSPFNCAALETACRPA